MKGPFTIIKNYGLPLETNSSNIEIPFSFLFMHSCGECHFDHNVHGHGSHDWSDCVALYRIAWLKNSESLAHNGLQNICCVCDT